MEGNDSPDADEGSKDGACRPRESVAMNPRFVFAIAAAILFASTPATAGASRPADSQAPVLTISQLGKVCVDDPADDGDKEICGPVYYVDWDGKVYRESNNKLNLQRGDTLDGARLVKADSLDLLP